MVQQVSMPLLYWHCSLSFQWCIRSFDERRLQLDAVQRPNGLEAAQEMSSAGPCLGGGIHNTSKSNNYSLLFSGPSVRGQFNWKRCNKCQGLAFAGNSTLGYCQMPTTIMAAETTLYLSMEILLVDGISCAIAPSVRWQHSTATQLELVVVPI